MPVHGVLTYPTGVARDWSIDAPARASRCVRIHFVTAMKGHMNPA